MSCLIETGKDGSQIINLKLSQKQGFTNERVHRLKVWGQACGFVGAWRLKGKGESEEETHPGKVAHTQTGHMCLRSPRLLSCVHF